MTVTEPSKPDAASPSAAADRMRRSRERRRAGSFCYLVELPGPLIDRLVNLGWLAAVARNDKAAARRIPEVCPAGAGVFPLGRF